MDALWMRNPPSARTELEQQSAAIKTIIDYNTTQKDSYVYSPLTKRDSIRLLRIQPADKISANLRLSITHTTLSTMTDSKGVPLTFIALSYCWGPQIFKEPVFIDSDPTMSTTKAASGFFKKKSATQTHEELENRLRETHPSTLLAWAEEAKQRATAAQLSYSNISDMTSTPKLHIGVNLHSALCHLRKKSTEVVVWADGLCINQQDIRERNHQVLHMRDIYQRAIETVVYLGDETGNMSLSAWNFLERTAAKEGEKGKHNAWHFQGDLGDVENDVLTRPWFQRVWVVQEIAVSANITMQCGQRSISWDDFCRVVLLEPRVNDRYGLSLQNKPLFENVRELFLTRCAFLVSCGLGHLLPLWYNAIGDQELRGNHVLDMVARSRRLKATDPRDKIFALLGISSGVDPGDSRVAVDYSKTVSQVYEDFAYYLIDAGRSFDILSYAGGKPGLDWPSWVPDWRETATTSRNILSCSSSDAGQRQQRQHYIPKMSLNRSKNGKVLRCRGVIIGRLHDISSTVQLHGNDELAFEQIRQECGAHPEKMKDQILERWKAYPWRIDRTAPKSAKTRAPFWDDRWNNSLLSDDAEPLRNREPFSTSLQTRLTLHSNEHTHRRLELKPSQSNNREENISHQLRPRVVLEHLIQRSRQTLIWTDDESMAVETVIDSSSIIDNRRLALVLRQDPSPSDDAVSKSPSPYRYTAIKKETPPASPEEHSLVLVPADASEGDHVVSLVGARVPFVVRRGPIFGNNSSHNSRHVWGNLIGECLVEDDSDVSGLASEQHLAGPSEPRTLQDFSFR